jgi:RNA polymerase sigma-70 factor (ECF subfamily)
MRPEGESQHNVTGLLARASSGDAAATDELFPVVYEQLRVLAASHLAGERANHTLQPTALVHEAYLRLVGPDEQEAWENRAHFFGAAAKAIRRILIEHARAKGRIKRGGGIERTTLDGVEAPAGPDMDLLDLHEAMERLAAVDEAKARVVELRYFGGLSLEETARVLGVSVPTISRHWEFARAWLHRDMTRGGVTGGGS